LLALQAHELFNNFCEFTRLYKNGAVLVYDQPDHIDFAKTEAVVDVVPHAAVLFSAI